jgi:hypothetical protein
MINDRPLDYSDGELTGEKKGAQRLAMKHKGHLHERRGAVKRLHCTTVVPTRVLTRVTSPICIPDVGTCFTVVPTF